MKTAEIRECFLRFFEKNGHNRVPSSPLVPQNDDTLLFTNAGMNQFKNIFLGLEKTDLKRACSVQKCVRAGGKHNDLENVGYTARHLTFFEMLGNFSFGDYFKEQATAYAWELLTSESGFALPAEKLWVTVYASDEQAYVLWRDKIGLPAQKIIRIGDKKAGHYVSDNFWQMGEIGPCGPCTEIFYDHGSQVWGGPPGSRQENGDRFVEIWNCVFMQFDRNQLGEMIPLGKTCVDTGMGLERMAAVLQGVKSNFETDLFTNLIAATARELQVPFALDNPSLKVIADHLRTCSFLAAEGVIPNNEGRGYVLRRIIRRAIRHGFMQGSNTPFFYRVVPYLVDEMGDAYPELIKEQEKIKQILFAEEEKFFQTVSTGTHYLQSVLPSAGKILSGEVAFKLYDTYGFPLDLTIDMAKEKGVGVDEEGFAHLMDAQRQRARLASHFQMKQRLDYTGEQTKFVGYESSATDARIEALYVLAGSQVKHSSSLLSGMSGAVVLDKTPFYAEGGGQVGDKGYLYRDGKVVFEVERTEKIQARVFCHWGQVKNSETLKVGDTVLAKINDASRLNSARNHSATHLLHAALRVILGEQVQQRGSLVSQERLRFDFVHRHAVQQEQLQAIEDLVNQKIREDLSINIDLVSYEEAVKRGAIALFTEKYQSEVRVVTMGNFSMELCGGTHVKRTGQIGFFKILNETGIAAGVRRIEAITGETFVSWLHAQMSLKEALCLKLKVKSAEDLFTKVHSLMCEKKELEKSMREMQQSRLQMLADIWLKKSSWYSDIQIVVEKNPLSEALLRETLMALIGKANQVVAILYQENKDKVTVGVGVSKALQTRFSAAFLLKTIMQKSGGGKGGGKADLAQGVVSDKTALLEVLGTLDSLLSSITLQDAKKNSSIK